MVSEGQKHTRPRLPLRPAGTTPDPRALDNEVERCILLLNHLLDHGNARALENQLLPELLRVSGELKKRKTRRSATRGISPA